MIREPKAGRREKKKKREKKEESSEDWWQKDRVILHKNRQGEKDNIDQNAGNALEDLFKAIC